MVALITKCEVLRADSSFAYLYLKEKGYSVEHRLMVHADQKKKTTNLRTAVIYKGKAITPKGLKEPKSHVKIGGVKLPARLALEYFKDISKEDPQTLSEHTLHKGVRWLNINSQVLLVQFSDMMRGYNAEGHPVHRLTARGEGQLTYLSAKTILKCTDMRGEPEINGVRVIFNSDGHLATVFR